MKSDPADISIVIPTYKRGEVLLQTIRHLMMLPSPPGEILVVDQTEEPSPDVLQFFQGLEENVPTFGTPAIRRIVLSKPSIPHAMNVGMREARGDIVLFLDDDIIPDEQLISNHWKTHETCPEAWAVVGQVLQPEDVGKKTERRERNAEKLKTETLKKRPKTEGVGGKAGKPISGCQDFKFSAFHASSLRQGLDFRFNASSPAWVENVMAGNLSVRREKALAVGGFDENFTPPVSYRFETEFAKRLIAAGGQIRFEPSASIRHLRAGQGGTRSRGSHLTSVSPLHGVGDYYYALRCGKGADRMLYMLRRPFREVCTKFHLCHPWWIPVKLIGELRAMALAVQLRKTDSEPLLKEAGRDGSKGFYDAQYQGERYAAYSSSESHPFHPELKQLLSRFGNTRGKWLEVGCGRGVLQDVVEDYTGVDISSMVSSFMKKPFFCAPAEALPFEDSLFDGVWSYAVLEHVDNPEQALLEIRRVLNPDGILFLSPAWQCRSWAGQDYAWKPFCELSMLNRIRKMQIPVRDSVAVRACSVFPRRLFHLVSYFLKKSPVRFYSRPLTPNYSEYKVIDADARHNMDPFDAILWFRSRGDRVLSHPSWRQAFFVRTGTIVVEVAKA